MGRYAVPPATRVQRFRQKAGNIAYTSGVTSKLPLPQSDYLTALDIISVQTITTTASSPVIAGYGAFGPLGLVQLSTNGQRKPFSANAYVADIYMRIRNHPYKSDLTSDPVTVSSTLPWVNHLRLPLTCDPANEKGAWYTGDNALVMTLSLGCSTAAIVFSTVNAATIQGSWDVYRETFNAPSPDNGGTWLDNISYYHEFLMQTTQVLKNGATQIVLPTDVDYERIVLIFYTGSDTDATFAPADALYTNVDLVINDKIHVFEVLAEAERRFVMDQIYNTVLPPGSCVIDMKEVMRSLRDILPTDVQNVSSLKLNIVSTSASNSVDVYTETVTDSPFAARWAQMAAANAGATKATATTPAATPAGAGGGGRR